MKNYKECLEECLDYDGDSSDYLIELFNSDQISEDLYMKVKCALIGKKDIISNKQEIIEEKKSKQLLESRQKIKLSSLNKLPPREFIIPKFGIEKGSLAIFCGTGSSGKTMLLQHVAVCVAAGKKLFGKFEVTQGSVLHMDEEQTEVQTTRRYIRLAAGAGVEDLDIERVVLGNRLDSQEILLTVQEELIKLFTGKKLILIDSLKKISEADENSAKIEMILKILKRVAEKADTTIILIHHMGKGGANVKQSGRGHSSIYDSVDIQLDIEYHQATENCSIKSAKSRDKAQFGKLFYKFKDVGDWSLNQFCSEKLEFEFIEEISKDKINTDSIVEIKILSTLNNEGTLNQSQIYDIVKGEKRCFNKAVDSLLANNFISVEKGEKNAKLFSITTEGVNHIEQNEQF